MDFTVSKILRFIIIDVLIIIMSILFIPPVCQAVTDVTVNGDWLLVDGEPFFVKAVGYEVGSRPGQTPWSTTRDITLQRLDFQRIKDAGFNTIRTWSPYTDQELQLAQEYGLMVIQGIWVDFNTFFSSDTAADQAVQDVKDMVGDSMQYDNILMYLVMNEPHPGIIETAGIDNALQSLTRLRDAVKSVDSTAIVSFSNCAMADFIPMDIWDVACFNVYPYGPPSVKEGVGFADYISWLKRTYAASKPLIITEFGLSVSPQGEGNWGYGGNTLEEQSEGDVWMYREIINGGATGCAVFMWMDGWWKNYEYAGDENTHDPEAEEWFGIIGIEDENFPEGVIRPAYYALQDFMETLVISPKDMQAYDDDNTVTFSIFANEDIKSVTIQMEGFSPISLTQSGGNWFEKKVAIPDILLNEDSIVYTVTAVRSDDSVTEEKYITISSPGSVSSNNPQLSIQIDKTQFGVDDWNIGVTIDGDAVLGNLTAIVVIYDYTRNETFKYTAVLDNNGDVQLNILNNFDVGYYALSAGLDYNSNRIGDMTSIYVETISAGPPPSPSYLDNVTVYPNPCKGANSITFANIESAATIKIYTIRAELVRTLEKTASVPSDQTWDLKNDKGTSIASGVYLYIITNPQGEKKT